MHILNANVPLHVAMIQVARPFPLSSHLILFPSFSVLPAVAVAGDRVWSRVSLNSDSCTASVIWRQIQRQCTGLTLKDIVPHVNHSRFDSFDSVQLSFFRYAAGDVGFGCWCPC